MTSKDDITKIVEKLYANQDNYEENPLLMMLKSIAEMVMEADVAERCNAEKGKHADERANYRSGSRERKLSTAIGDLMLSIPKVRHGGYQPPFLEPRKRSDKALLSLVIEAYTNGISTRKMDKLVKALGVEGISASEVSRITDSVKESANAFKERALEEEYPVIWADALYECIRCDGSNLNMAVMVIKAVDMKGRCQVIGIEAMQNESEETYTEMFNKLKDRGLKKVWLVVSDAHQGLKNAITKCFLGCAWQRCKVHFMRNITASLSKKIFPEVQARLSQIWNQPTKEEAVKYANAIIKEYETKCSKAMECLSNGLEDSLTFYDFEHLDKRKISSNNPIERENREIRRRTRVVGVFPSIDSYLKLICTLYMERQDDWDSTGKSYFSADAISEQKKKFDKCLAKQAA